MSIADLSLVGTVALVQVGWLDHVPKDMIATTFPALQAAFEAAAKDPLVAAELAPPS